VYAKLVLNAGGNVGRFGRDFYMFFFVSDHKQLLFQNRKRAFAYCFAVNIGLIAE